MDNKRIALSTNKIKREKKIKKIVRIVLLLILLLLIIFYMVIGIVYNNSNFSITLDRNLYYDKGLIVYDDPDYKVYRTELYATSPATFDNVSYRWLPEDINDSRGGSHNGANYLAYTFYVENMGYDTADYYSEIEIVDVIKKVDEAVRIRVYKNGVDTTYAKASSKGEPEPHTVPFLEDKLIALDHVTKFRPGDIDKYTVVMWLEGADPECNDNILGGEIKIEMRFNSEHVDD